LRAIVDGLGCGVGVLAVLVGAVSNSVEEVGPRAKADRVDATAKVIGQVQHVGNADLAALREAGREGCLGSGEGGRRADEDGRGLHLGCLAGVVTGCCSNSENVILVVLSNLMLSDT
jgi:hypothetical protein